MTSEHTIGSRWGRQFVEALRAICQVGGSRRVFDEHLQTGSATVVVTVGTLSPVIVPVPPKHGQDLGLDTLTHRTQ